MDNNFDKNYVDGSGIPLGFGMALAQNYEAMSYFSALDEQQKQSIIEGTHGVRSKSEMRQYVSNLTNGNSFH
jgi:hypothetical protein